MRVEEPLMQGSRSKIRGIGGRLHSGWVGGGIGGKGADTSVVELRCQPTDLRKVLRCYPGLASRARAMRRKLARNGKEAGR